MRPTLWLAVVLAAITASAADRVMEEYRIPEDLEPVHYNLKVLTNLGDDFSYSGEEQIDFVVKKATDRIVLHSKNLNIFENETKFEELTDSSEDSRIKRDVNYGGIRRWSMRGRTKPKAADTNETTTAAPDLTSEKKVLLGVVPKESDKKEELLNENIKNRVEKPKEEKIPEMVKQEPEVEITSEVEKPTTESDPTPASTTTTTTTPRTTTPTTTTTTTTTTSTTEASYAVIEASEAPTTKAPTTPYPSTLQSASPLPESPTTPSTEDNPDEPFEVVLHDYDAEKDFLIVQLNKLLQPGKKYRLHLSFRGFLSDSLTGFHRVAYSKKNSKRTTWLASTVFEPLEARTAFPCFDEPQYKATFDITLGHDKKYSAISNMPLKNTKPLEGRSEWVLSCFERTPKVSPYLVAFLISDLEYITPKQNQTVKISNGTDTNTTYRFWARHDVLHKTRYASKVVPSMKSYLEELFGVADPLPKHDFVALPSFISSALENWGIIAFAEKNILYTPSLSSIFSLYEITQMLGHEISHMWFGNQVTPKWWDQIWLNEGFANYFEVLATDHVQPSWDAKTISTVFSYLKVFSIDAMHSSHPLVPQVKTPNDLNEIFDSITYQKGYYIVRMLNYTLGEEAFMKGVRTYLKKYQYSNVEEDDLWEILNEYGHEGKSLPDGIHMRDIMRSWTRETGYPVVDINRDYEGLTANVTQRRFLRPKEDIELRRPSRNVTEPVTRWWIPLTYTTGEELNFHDTSPRVWLKPDDEVTVLKNMPNGSHFVLMNLEAAGLYRVNYDYQNWDLLIDYLISGNYSDISVINRVQVLDDLLDFARAGEISYSKALDATSYLKREKHYLPWKAALSNFEYISRMFRSSDNNRAFKKFMRNLVSPRLDELGFEPRKNESLFDSLNRKQIIKWACRTGHRQCSRKSINLFKKWTEEKKPDDHNPIPSNLRSVVYCTAIEHGGAKDWQFLWQRYLSDTVVTDRGAILQGLGCSKNTRTLRKYLDWSIKESSGLKKQDTPAVFKAVAKNDVGFGLAKTFLKERLPEIKKYLGNNSFHLPQMIEALASKMNQPSHLKELEELEDEHFATLRSIPRSLKQATERVKFNIGWLEQNSKSINNWLKQQKL